MFSLQFINNGPFPAFSRLHPSACSVTALVNLTDISVTSVNLADAGAGSLSALAAGYITNSLFLIS
jgi:hypothetical protein